MVHSEHQSALEHTGRPNCLAFLPDGKTLATSSFDSTGSGVYVQGEFSLWDVDSGKRKVASKATLRRSMASLFPPTAGSWPPQARVLRGDSIRKIPVC